MSVVLKRPRRRVHKLSDEKHCGYISGDVQYCKELNKYLVNIRHLMDVVKVLPNANEFSGFNYCVSISKMARLRMASASSLTVQELPVPMVNVFFVKVLVGATPQEKRFVWKLATTEVFAYGHGM